MTAHRDLKSIIRERQHKTGESYTTARAHVMRERARLLGVEPEGSEPTAATVPTEAVILKVNEQSARVLVLGEAREVTFRSGDVRAVVPGHVVTLVFERRWIWRGDAYASGKIENPRIDVAKLGLKPLPLEGGELDDIAAHSEPYRRPDPYAPLWKKLTAKPRPCFEFDGIAWGALPGLAGEANPTCDAAELLERGDRDPNGFSRHRPALHRRARSPRQHGLRTLAQTGDCPLRNWGQNRRTITACRIRRAPRLGSHSQPAVPQVPARLRPMSVAAGENRRGSGRLRTHSLVQSERQPRCTVLLA
jgi:hypothetical protein